ncbi:hypothetical protein ABZX40_15540 [Streptomyces sp. NPDC004610]|uniref:hypothetical protein n=1 Tax=unclassified Streptomyces TaxID=2593676 RepID=UPI0033B842EC
MPPHHEPNRRRCGAPARMPVDLVALMLAHIPDTSDPRVSVGVDLRCQLEAHDTGPHLDLTWELDDASHGEVWAEWPDGGPPERVAVLPDCNAVSGPTPKDVACMLYEDHQGCHTFEYTDPDRAAADGYEPAAEGDPRGTP